MPWPTLPTELKKIQARAGSTIAELHAVTAAIGLPKHSQRRNWLMQQFKLGYGDANAVALFVGKALPDLGGGVPPAPSAPDAEPLAAIYSRTKTGLRPLRQARTTRRLR